MGNRQSFNGEPPEYGTSLENPDFTFLEKDIVETETFEDLGETFDVIVRLAAFKIPRYGNTIDTLKINSIGTENVLEFAKRLKPNAFWLLPPMCMV
ncbi:MAG: hypothetical protein R3B93_23320 [Bacteroidia bacterium]